MKAAAVTESSASKAPAPTETRKQATVIQPINPVWQRMATSLAGGQSAAANSQPPPPPPSRHGVPQVQNSDYVQRVCNQCEDEKEEQKIESGSHVQAKVQSQSTPPLTIGAPGDQYEQEADRIADHVMRTPDSKIAPRIHSKALPITSISLQRALVQRECTDCEEASPKDDALEEQEDDSDSLKNVHSLITAPGAGAPLSSSMRRRIEPAVGANLSGVRVHSNARSQSAAAGIQAKAFTNKNNIYLGAGQDSNDLRLMAHEATHVVQQGAASPTAEELKDEAQSVHADEASAIDEQETPEAEPENELATEELEQVDIDNANVDLVEAAELDGEDTAAEADPDAAIAEQALAEDSADDAVTEDQAAGDEQATADESQSETQSQSQATTASQEESLANIAAAPESNFKSHAQLQSDLIIADSIATEEQIRAHGAQRRAEVSAQFAGVRATISEFIEGNIASAQESVAAAQSQITEAVTSGLNTASDSVDSAFEAAQGHVDGFSDTVNGFITDAITSVGSTVGGVATQITNVINSIPIPNVPGIAAARNFAIGVVNTISNTVSSALATALNIIRGAFNVGMELVGALLSTLRSALDSVLELISTALTTLLDLIFSTLNSLLEMVATAVRAALDGVIFPIMNSVESLVLSAISRLEEQSIEQVHKNRDAHLQAIALSLTGPCGGVDADGMSTQATSEADWMAAVSEIAQAAMAINRRILANFIEQTSSFFAIFVATVASIIAEVFAMIAAFVAAVIEAISALVLKVVTFIADAIMQSLMAIQALLESFVEAIADVLTYVADLIESAGEAVAGFAEEAYNWISSAVSTVISNFVSGKGLGLATLVFPLFDRGPIPAPPVEVPPIPGPTLPAPPVPDSNPPIPLPDVLPIVLIILIILFLILLWLIIKWIIDTWPRPRPLPCEIETQTLVPAPDGGPDTRKQVGVKEEVRMSTASPAVWVATNGTITPDGVDSIIWTAPVNGDTCTITATPFQDGCSCSIAMIVVPPTQRFLSNPVPTAYEDELAGSGFVADVTILPLNVSFSKIETQEQAIAATASGYYDTVLGWNGKVHPQGAWVPIDGRNDGIIDTVGTVPPGTGGDFNSGIFQWPIPQYYREAGGATGIPYSVGTHTQLMAGPDGEELTDKEGASRTRKPAKTVKEDPLKADTARTIPSLVGRLDRTSYGSGTVTLLNGASATAGTNMLTEYLTKYKTGGSEPTGQGAIYGFRNLPTLRAHTPPAGGPPSGYKADQVYIRGHLLNHNIGGIGDAENLYPITGKANSDHERRVEDRVKTMVIDDGLVVKYNVLAATVDGPYTIDVSGDGSCTYEHLDADFSCTYATYKLYSDNTVEENTPVTVGVQSRFDEAGFVTNVSAKGCWEKSNP